MRFDGTFRKIRLIFPNCVQGDRFGRQSKLVRAAFAEAFAPAGGLARCRRHVHDREAATSVAQQKSVLARPNVVDQGIGQQSLFLC